MDLDKFIRTIPDFPKTGINFKDITPLLNHAEAFQFAIDNLAKQITQDFDVVVGIESRGFIFGAALAYKLNKRFVPVRKRNKLPAEVHRTEYKLEYGSDILEIHKDALSPQDKVIIVDDLLATGGTVSAVEKLVALSEADIKAIVFLIHLEFLMGHQKLKCPNIVSLLRYN